MESTNITERGWGGPDVPPAANVRRTDPEVRLAGGEAVQWGLAALLHSGLLLLMVPIGLIVLLLVPILASVNPSWDATGRVVSTILIPIGTVVFDVLALVSLVLAVVALRVARARRQPVALQAAALLLALGGVVGWAVTTVAAIFVLVSIWNIHT